MAYSNVRDDFLACSDGRTPSRVPIFALGLEFDCLQAGLTCRETRTNVDKMVQSQVEAVHKYDYDWAIIFPDDYIEFEPLGLTMRDDEDHPTMPETYFPMDRGTLGRLTVPDFRTAMRCPIHLEMLRKTKDALGDTALVMGRIGGPFSALGLIYGIDELMTKMLLEPELVRDNMRFFIDYQIAFGKLQLEAGADVIWLGDCCADSKFVRVEHLEEFPFRPAYEVASALKEAGGLVIYHTNETSMPHLAKQVELPVHAVNVGEGVSIAEVKKALQPKVALMGNFDCLLLRDGAPEVIAQESEKMIRENTPGSGYMFNTGEGVMANTPPENVEAMMRTAKAVSSLV